jgi:hypothetical protein
VGQFVNQNEGGTTGKHRIEVEFLKRSAAVGDLAPRKDGKASEESFRLGAAVCIHPADQDIESLRLTLMGRL